MSTLFLLLSVPTPLGTHDNSEFLTAAVLRLTSVRPLVELFGTFELGLDLVGGTRAVVSVGGLRRQSHCSDSG